MSVVKNPVLVIGGAGYIGSHVCRYLSNLGYCPISYDNLSTGFKWAVKWGPLIRGDLGNKSALIQTINEYEPLAVMNFAGVIAVGESVSDPALYYQINIAKNLQMLDAIRETKVSRIVFSSSAAVYKSSNKQKLMEDDEKWPNNPYGWTKLVMEQILEDYCKAYSISSISLRYFNAAGSAANDGIGESHEPETHLIPRILDVALGLSTHAHIYGSDYDTPDGTCLRDYVHVNDLAAGHFAALDRLIGSTGPICEAYNLGNGDGVSVLQVISAIENVTGKSIPKVFSPRRNGDLPRLVADIGRAGEMLKWTPVHRNIEDLVRDAWAWSQCKDLASR